MSDHGWDSACPTCVSVRRGVEQASRGEYAERDDLMSVENAALIDGVRDALSRLDGSTLAAVALITGFSIAEIDALGGLDDA